MIINPSFEIVEIANEYMAVPIGNKSESFRGIVALNEATAFLLRHLSSPKTKEGLIDLLVTEYDVDRATADQDVSTLIEKLLDIGLIEE